MSEYAELTEEEELQDLEGAVRKEAGKRGRMGQRVREGEHELNELSSPHQDSRRTRSCTERGTDSQLEDPTRVDVSQPARETISSSLSRPAPFGAEPGRNLRDDQLKPDDPALQ